MEAGAEGREEVGAGTAIELPSLHPLRHEQNKRRASVVKIIQETQEAIQG